MTVPTAPSAPETLLAGPRVLWKPKYVWTAVAVVAVLQLGVAGMRHSFVSSEVRPLHRQLAELPMTLGDWTGKDVTLEKRIVDAVGADQLVDRAYTYRDGTKLTASCAVWLSPTEWVPHRPPLCYAANGWKSIQSQSLALPNHPEVKIAVDTFEQSGARIVVAYWYQLE